MKYKLAISDIVIALIAFTQKDGNALRKFEFNMTFDRVGVTEWAEAIKSDAGTISDSKVKTKLMEVAKGWDDRQKFVCNEDGSGAEFCQEAFEFMLDQPGVLTVVMEAYGKAVAAKSKN